MDLVLSAALTSITYTIYLFKKNNLNELKSTKKFPCTSKSKVEAAEAVLEKDITYYLEGLVTPIKPNQFITCADNKRKAVVLKNVIKRHSVRWSNFWKDWLPEVEVISFNGQTVPFNIYKHNHAQATIPKLTLQDVMNLELPIISDNFINQNKKSIVKSIMDYVNGERFSGIENMEQGYTIGHPITVIGKFKQPVTPGNVQGITSTPTPTPTSPSTPSPSPSPSELTPVKSPSSLDPDDLLVQSTGLPVLITEFKDDDTYCIISPKTFKEIVEEEAKGVNKWKWIVIGSTSIVGGVIAFRIWRHYRRRRRREEEAQRSEEQERLQAATVPENPGILDMLRDIMNWLIMDDPYDIDINRTPSFIAPTPITEYIPEPIPIDPNDNTETPTENQNGTSSTGQNNTNPSTSTGNDGNDSTPTNDENLCVVCLTEKREYAYLPCRHLCVCHHCVHYLEKCPLCRSPIHSYMKIFS